VNLTASELPPLIALVGPTAVGKTAVSLELAKKFEMEIISADSRLVYRGLDIGTAKPSSDELTQIPHHLVNVVGLDQPWSLGDYREAVKNAIRSIHLRGKMPMLVGGTGQYVSAILEGWQPPPRPSTDDIREELERLAMEQGSQALHSRLAELDPASAERIDHRNVRRVIRALEIIAVTGKPASDVRIQETPPYRILRIGLNLPRQQLFRRIDTRLEAMLAAGWELEVRDLMSQGCDFGSPPFSAIGYRQLRDYVRGEKTMQQVSAEIKKGTRQFVRRQANWFKADDDRIHWFENTYNVVEEISARIRIWLDAS
jgi:tRNA dimethylallyltransferase